MTLDYAALISQLAGNAAGQAASQMDRDKLMALIQGVVDDTGKINVPQLQKILLQQQGKSEFRNIKEDPRYRSEQDSADAQLNDVINSGGLTLSDRAALNRIRNSTARTESAGRNAILGGMAARGTLDSGAQEAAQLAGNQQSANSLAAADEDTAGKAQARAYQAIQDRAKLAGQGLDRSYREQSDAARAQDAINAGNTAIANAGIRYNAALPQQNFNNQLELSKAKANPAYALAGAHGAAAQNSEDQWNKAGAVGAAALRNANGSSSNGNTGSAPPPPPQATESGSAPGDWNQYQSSEALGSDPTRVEYDEEGNPIGRKLGSNF